MSLKASYDDDNVFAKIIRGDMPKVSVFEDEDTLAFMDVFPQSEGHVLVIDKAARSVNLTDMTPERLSIVMETVHKVARAMTAALNPDGFRVVQFNGEAAGQTVYHTHFHVIPVWEGRPLGRHGGDMADTEELEATAKKIRNAL
jgi:histidine triad (HIT) family protein